MSNTEFLEGQGQKLAAIRRRYGRNKSQFAKDLGIDRVTLWHYERGTRVISTQALYALWDKYKVTPNAMLGIDRMNL